MKKHKYFLFALAVLIAAGLTGCFSPWTGNRGVISISLGPDTGGRYIDYSEGLRPDYEHVVTLRGPGGTVTKTLKKGESSAVFEVAPGKWTVDVRAIGDQPHVFHHAFDNSVFPGRMLCALAIVPDVEVIAGRSARVRLEMQSATEVENMDQLIYVIENVFWHEVIVLKQNLELTRSQTDLIQIRAKEITFIADKDIAIKKDPNYNGAFFSVHDFGNLTFGMPGMAGTITVDGYTDAPDTLESTYYPLIVVERGSLHMNDGITLKNNKASRGGAVNIGEDNESEFFMEGGAITGNEAIDEGGGVYVGSMGSFTMNGGIINNNEAKTGGGGVHVGGTGSFIMNGGSINNNETDKGGGVFVNTGSFFTLNGGAINANKANIGGGVLVEGGTNPSPIPNFLMNGGVISANKANEGGGVFVESGHFNMTGGFIRTNMAYNNGAGVFIYQGIFEKMPSGGIVYGKNGGANANSFESHQPSYVGEGNSVYWISFNVGTATYYRNRTINAGDNLSTIVFNELEWDFDYPD